MRLVVENIVVRHHASHPPVVAGVSTHVDSGEVLAVVGANGSGKSTFARALAGLIPMEAGSVSYLSDAGYREARVGIVLQDPSSQSIAQSVADDIAWASEQEQLPPDQTALRVARSVNALSIEQLIARDPAELSGGQQQKVAVAALLASDIDALILDEPTAMLDLEAREAVVSIVRELAASGCAIIWITQEADEIAYSDRVLVLDAGHAVWDGGSREYVNRNLAHVWELELPSAARIAAQLSEMDAWNYGVFGLPLSFEDLADNLGA